MIRQFMKRMDWYFYGNTFLSILTAVIAAIFIAYLPMEFAYENQFIEVAQLFILGIAFYLCLSSKIQKDLFTFLSLIIVILFLREINFGRIFFPVGDQPNVFMRKSELPFGHLINPAYALIMLGTAIYFFYRKIWRYVPIYLKKARIPAMDSILLVVGVMGVLLGEEVLNNSMVEECLETVMYVAATGIIYLYSRNEKFILKD